MKIQPTTNLYIFPVNKTLISDIVKDNEAHQGPYKGALDMIVPLGTSVFAPFDGQVIKIQDGSEEWGKTREFTDKANYISLQHANGEFTELIHLAKGSFTIKEGERVKQGTALAKTGLSGWMTEPHLHWHVFRLDDGPERFKCLEVQFRDEPHTNIK